MALEFLSSLLQAVPAINALFSGSTSAPYLKQQQAQAQHQAQLTDALTNTQNPIYANLFNQYNQQANQDMAHVLSEAQGQNRAASALGRTPLFSQERGGEQLFRALMQGREQASNSAADQARTNIKASLGGAGQAQSAYNSLSQFGQNKNAAGLAGYSAIGDLLNGTHTAMPSFNTAQQQPMMQQQAGQQSGFDSVAELLKKLQGQQDATLPSIRGIGYQG